MQDLGFGTVLFKEKEYALTQQPYIDGVSTWGIRPHFIAIAVDKEENEYKVIWSIKDKYIDEEGNTTYKDEEEACEWEKPAEITLI